MPGNRLALSHLPSARDAVVTIVTSTHAHFARALGASLHSVDPEIPFYVVVVDALPGEFDFSDVGGRFVAAESLGVPQWPRFAFQYLPLEAVCALKPAAIRHVLDRGHQRVIYLDGDIQVYHSLQTTFHQLDRSEVVLTPHVTSPVPDDGRLHDDLAFLRAGTFNAGFVGVKDSETGRNFVTWWGRKTSKECIHDLASGKFADQNWLSLVPSHFSGVQIETGCQYNVAYWNLHERRLSASRFGRPLVNGIPLVFFHFSGFDPLQADQLSRHQDRFRIGDFPVLRTLVDEYITRLNDCGLSESSRRRYRLGQLDDGTAIHDHWREAVRINHPLLKGIDDPFSTKDHPDLKRRLIDAARDARWSRVDWRLAMSTKQRVLHAMRSRLSMLFDKASHWCAAVAEVPGQSKRA